MGTPAVWPPILKIYRFDPQPAGDQGGVDHLGFFAAGEGPDGGAPAVEGLKHLGLQRGGVGLGGLDQGAHAEQH